MAWERLTSQEDDLLLTSASPDQLDLSDMTPQQRLGLIKENFKFALWNSVAKEFGLKVVWQGKKSYDRKRRNEERRGCDFLLFKNDTGQLYIGEEDKNILTPKERYGETIAQRDVIRHFEGINPQHKVLSISNFHVYQPCAEKAIIKENIHVFETGKVIGRKDFRSKTWFILKNKLRTFLTMLEKIDKDKQLTLDYIYQQHPEINPSRQLFLGSLTEDSSLTGNVVHNADTDKIVNNKEQLIDTPFPVDSAYIKQAEDWIANFNRIVDCARHKVPWAMKELEDLGLTA